MGVMKDLQQEAAAGIRGKGKTHHKNRAGVLTGSDFEFGLKRLVEELTGQTLKRVISKMNSAVRSSAVKAVRRASSASTIGESMKSKMTRGDWKNPLVTGIDSKSPGTEYLKGGWYGQTLKDRGANKPSMANNGGEVGRGKGGTTGMISRTDPKTKGRGYIGITGPRYGEDNKDNSKHGYNYAHTLEFGANHKSWGQHPSKMEARPFLGPAAAESMPKQIAILKKELIKYGKGQ